jgi:hypothetical protein
MHGGLKSQCLVAFDDQEIVPSTSHLRESEERVNVHVTGHGAVIALGLVFLKTGNRVMAARLAAPCTLAGLDEIRPDILLVRSVLLSR